jgi:hypothetical protein
MESTTNYFDFIKEKGRPLSEINPGSDEIALTIDNALNGLELLKTSHVEILGGDIFSEDNGELIYAYQLWGEEYHYLNWSCDRLNSESKDDYLKRSYDIAKQAIIKASKVAEKLNKKCYIVFVTE